MTKSIFYRPLDMFYIVFFLIHLTWSLPFGGQPLYPTWFTPASAKEFVQNYINDTNDPWMLAVWDLVERPFEWVWAKVFLYFEVFVIIPVMTVGIYALIKGKQTYYPWLLAYAGMATLSTTVTTVMTVLAPNKADTKLSSQLAFYAMTEESKRTVAIANAVFLLPPVIMLFDMINRINRLIVSGIKAENKRKRV